MLGCDSFFYYPNARKYASPAEEGLKFESVHFAAKDGPRLHGWFFPATGEPKGTVLHLHGNAGNITGHFAHIAWLPTEGWNVLCFDYRGYGESEGKVTRAGTVSDAHAALDYLLKRPGGPARIVVFGQSLGRPRRGPRPSADSRIGDGWIVRQLQRIVAHIRRNPFLLVLAWWLPKLCVVANMTLSNISPRSPTAGVHHAAHADGVVNPAIPQRLYAAAGSPKSCGWPQAPDHYGDAGFPKKPPAIARFLPAMCGGLHRGASWCRDAACRNPFWCLNARMREYDVFIQ